MGQIFDAERQDEMQQNMWNFQQMMMTVNPTLMNSPCSCLSVYQPCRGPQADVSGPEPCTFRVGTSSTVGHSISGPGPNQCDSMPTRRRQTVDNQSGPYSSQLRSTSPTSAGAQLGSAVRQHDYDGVPVQSTYFHNSKLPATLISFFIAGETILEVPHPMFSQLFVHSVVASFSCTSLEENMATPTDTDWNQVYTLMLKRLAKDLHDSHNRLKNALELNRIQEYQQRYILNDRYFQTAGYTPENRLTTISESFATFCNRHWVNKLKWQHLCVNYACTLVVRFVPIVPLLNISRTCHWSVTMGDCWESNCIWIFLKLNMWTLILNPVTLLLTIVRNLLLQKFFEKVSFAPVLHNTRIRFILQAFIVAPKYVVITLRRHTLQHKLRHFEKLVSIVIIRILSDRFVYTERREVVSPIILPSVSVERSRTMADCNSLTVFIVIEIRGGPFVLTSVRFLELLPFCKLYVHDFSLLISFTFSCMGLTIICRWNLGFKNCRCSLVVHFHALI